MTVGKFFLFLFLLVIVAPVLFVVIVLVDMGYINTYRFTYRLVVEVDVDGKTKTGSSLYEVIAEARSRIVGLPGNKVPQAVSRGVSPLIDLGPYGTLIAARAYNMSHYEKYLESRQRKYDWSLDPTRPLYPSELPYHAYFPKNPRTDTWPEPHRTLTKQRDRVQSKRMPPFIWIPPSGNFREARQLMPDQFAEVIGPGVKLKAVWIEPAWAFWVPTSYDKTPRWLDELYSEQERRRTLSTKELLAIEQSPHAFVLGSEMITGTRWR